MNALISAYREFLVPVMGLFGNILWVAIILEALTDPDIKWSRGKVAWVFVFFALGMLGLYELQ